MTADEDNLRRSVGHTITFMHMAAIELRRIAEQAPDVALELRHIADQLDTDANSLAGQDNSSSGE